MKYPMGGKAKAILELVRPKIAVLGLTGAFVGGILGGIQFVSFDLLLAMVVVFLMIAAANSLNDYFDWNLDKVAHPERPIPSGKLSPQEVLHFVYVSFFLALVLSAFINVYGFGMVVFSMGFLVLYEKYFKGIGLAGNIVVAFLSGMALIFGGVAVGQAHNAIILFLMAFLVMLGREILKDVQDVEGDIHVRKTLPMKIGKKNALYTGSLFIVATIALTPLPFWWNILSWWYIVVIIPAVLLFIYAIILSVKDIKNIDATVDLLRTASALALVGFILGVLI